MYVRISDDKAADAAGVGRQEKDCRELAARQGWPVLEVYVENDTSAFKRRSVRLPDGTTALRVVRPAFRRMLEDLASGACDALVGYDLDRVARDPRDLEDLIDVVERRRIPTKAVTGSLDLGSDAGVTMARVMVAVANKSSRDTARRVARKQEELAEQGKVSGGGIRSYGYERDGRTVCKAEAEVVQDMARRVLAGESLRRIAQRLNAEGIATVRGGPWLPRSVHSVVTKARNAGLREYRGEVVGEAVWPPILDRDTWERVRLALADRGAGATNQLVRWLTGVLLCGCCGRALAGAPGANRGPRYWCNTPRGGCGRIAVDALRAEAFVVGLLVAYLGRPDVLADLRAATSSASGDQARREAQADNAQLRELATLWGSKQVTTAEYLAARKEIEARLATWQGILRAALPGVARQLLEGDVAQRWEALAPQERRDVARLVFPQGITVRSAVQRGLRGFDPQRLVPVGWSAT